MNNQRQYSIKIYDERSCDLGEGIFWHPQRQQLFWFDILKKRLLTQETGHHKHWQFDEYVSAAGWIDYSTLLIASESKLFTFGLDDEKIKEIAELEKNSEQTRSNDGRSDPWGGFWISTMDKNGESPVGSIYRYYKGNIVKLFQSLTIPNSICFSNRHCLAYFSDTKQQVIFKQLLDPEEGWPVGEKEVLIDFSDLNLNPDGAVTDAEGKLWCAMWGSSQVVRISEEGKILNQVYIPARQPSCPAFGGNSNIMYLTSAKIDLDDRNKQDGQTFFTKLDIKGNIEPPVKI